MYRGTTPNQIFKLDFLLTNEASIFITYSQNDEVVIEKDIEEISKTTDETTGFSILSFKMTQDESLLFEPEMYDQNHMIINPVSIQIRIKFEDSTAIASDYVRASISEVLKDGEI